MTTGHGAGVCPPVHTPSYSDKGNGRVFPLCN